MRARQNGWPRRVDRLPVDLIYYASGYGQQLDRRSKRSAIETRRGGPLNPRARARPPPRQFTIDNRFYHELSLPLSDLRNDNVDSPKRALV